jgi:hypothetical protein
MATGDRKEFALGGEEYEVEVVGPYGGDARRPWWKFWVKPEPPMFEFVTITRMGTGGGKPLKTLMYANSLPQMTSAEFAHRLERTEEINAMPSAAAAIALVRDGEEFVTSRGEWNCILLTAFIAGWERSVPSEAPMPDAEAADLLSLFEQIFEQVPRAQLIQQRMMPPDGFIDFLRKGGFEIREIG